MLRYLFIIFISIFFIVGLVGTGISLFEDYLEGKNED